MYICAYSYQFNKYLAISNREYQIHIFPTVKLSIFIIFNIIFQSSVMLYVSCNYFSCWIIFNDIHIQRGVTKFIDENER